MARSSNPHTASSRSGLVMRVAEPRMAAAPAARSAGTRVRVSVVEALGAADGRAD
jgi:hypothetical protein